MRFDCEVWCTFLENFRTAAVCHPMVDLKQNTLFAEQLNFYSDAIVNASLGMGAVFNEKWLFAQWEEDFIKQKSPSIEYLELTGLVGAVLTWGENLHNMRVIVYCDNMSVVAMVNSMSSNCKNCMYLLRLLTLNNMVHNRRVFARHVRGIHNNLSHTLSRLQFDCFSKLAPPGMNKESSKISALIWPLSAIWQD